MRLRSTVSDDKREGRGDAKQRCSWHGPSGRVDKSDERGAGGDDQHEAVDAAGEYAQQVCSTGGAIVVVSLIVDRHVGLKGKDRLSAVVIEARPTVERSGAWPDW